MTQLASPPGVPSLLAGFLDLGGTAIPILRLDRLFNLDEQLPGLHTPLVILRAAGSRLGVLVGGVRKIVKVARIGLIPLPPKQMFSDCATAAFEVDGTIVHLLSPERLLLEKESRILTEFRILEQQRLNGPGEEAG